MFLVERVMRVFLGQSQSEINQAHLKLLPRDVSVCGSFDSFHFAKSLSRSSDRTSELIAMYADHLRGTTLERHGTKHSTVCNSKIMATTKVAETPRTFLHRNNISRTIRADKNHYAKLTANFSQTMTSTLTASLSSRAPQ